VAERPVSLSSSGKETDDPYLEKDVSDMDQNKVNVLPIAPLARRDRTGAKIDCFYCNERVIV